MRRAAAGVLVAVLVAGACAAGGDLTDTEKRARIAELYKGYEESFTGLPSLTVEELVEMLGTPNAPVLVDVRTPAEQAVSMIPGAISREEFERRGEEFDDRPVVAYCTIGYRSGLYAEELRQQGWDAYNLKGSILSWTHSGQPLEVEGRETRRLHVYGSRWDLAAADYEAEW